MPHFLPGSSTPNAKFNPPRRLICSRPSGSSSSASSSSSSSSAVCRFSPTEPMAVWKGKLLIVAMGMSAVVLLVDRNARAMAQNRPALRDTTELAQRPPASEPQQVLWVNSQTGNDAKADGSEQAPFRTITRALQAAQANTLIQLAPGTYSTDSGEVFPLALKSGVTIQGNPDELGQGTVIRGGGDYSSSSLGRQNVTLVGTSQASLVGVTVTNPTVRGHGLWVETGSPTIRSNTFISSTNAGLFSAGSSAPIVQSNLFVLNRVSGVVVAGYAQPQLIENVFQRTGSGIAVAENAAPQIVGNRISQNRDGIVVQGESQPILRNNTIEDSERDGIVVIAQAQPNLGTVQEPGQNSFHNNRQHDIDALATTQTLPAFGNQLTGNRIAGQVDLTGQAPLVSVTTVASAADHLPATRVSRITAVPVAVSQPVSNPPSAPLPASTTSYPAQRSLAVRTPPKRQPASIASLPPIDSSSGLPAASLPAAGLPAAGLPAASSPIRPAPVLRLPRTPQPAPAVIPTAAPSTVDKLLAELRQMRQSMATASTSRPLGASSTGPTAAPGSARAISIPVPPPESGRSAATVARAIPIPVPSPAATSGTSQAVTSTDSAMGSVLVRAVASLPRQDFSGLAAPVLGGSRISVPAPAASPVPTRTAAPVVVAAANPTSPTTRPTSSNLLPVPADTIPLGNTGDLPKISLAGLGDARGSSASLDLQYRVLVSMEDEQAETLVQSLVPDAFAVSLNGQALMQVGAFSSYENAQEVLALLSQNGLRGMIQPIE